MKTKQIRLALPKGVWGRARRVAIATGRTDAEVVIEAIAKGLPSLEANQVLDQWEADRDAA